MSKRLDGWLVLAWAVLAYLGFGGSVAYLVAFLLDVGVPALPTACWTHLRPRSRS